jgi:hypothetical protein
MIVGTEVGHFLSPVTCDPNGWLSTQAVLGDLPSREAREEGLRSHFGGQQLVKQLTLSCGTGILKRGQLIPAEARD